MSHFIYFFRIILKIENFSFLFFFSILIIIIVNVVVQMSVYYAPAFFSHLLGKCLRRKNPIHGVAKLGLTVLGTFTVVWWPYLHSTDALLGVNNINNFSCV